MGQNPLLPTRGYQLNPARHDIILKNPSLAIKKCLEKIDLINFNIFDLQRLSSGNEFMILGYQIASKSNLIELNNINLYIFYNFLDGLSRCYNDMTVAPYHSRTHAADVLQALHVFLGNGGLAELL